MHNFACHVLGLLALAAPATASATSANFTLESSGTPAGFVELASERDVLVDVFFGGRKVGEAFAVAEPGTLRFRSADDLLAILPQVTAADELKTALAGELPTQGFRAKRYRKGDISWL